MSYRDQDEGEEFSSQPAEWVRAEYVTFGPDQRALLATWFAVQDAPEQTGEFEGHLPDLYQWASLADLSVTRVGELWPALRDLKVLAPDRTVPAGIEEILRIFAWRMITEGDGGGKKKCKKKRC